MYYVYVLKSKKDNSLYLGFTGDLRRRFQEHNIGSSKYCRNKMPWELIYYEAYKVKSDAINRERKLKQFKKGYAMLKKRLLGSLK